MNREQIIAMLHATACSCVVANGERIESFHERGVKDLHRLLCDDRALLDGAFIADKVVGKATAFLYCLLGVKTVHANVLSDAAAQVFARANIPFSCDTRVPAIRNRTNTGLCPMENATKDIDDPLLALAAIRQTLKNLQN